MSRRRALVLGGTGAIGSAVLRGLARAGVPTTFTYLTNEDKARALASELDQQALRVDLSVPSEVRALDVDGVGVLVACAVSPLPEHETDEEITRALSVSVHAPLVLCRALAGPANVVFVGALAASQALPLPAPFAAAQGALGPLAMALAKELGPRGVRVNLVTGGLVGAGMSEGFDPLRVEDFRRFSALRRLGTADEIAAPVLWLALENTYVSGKVLSANGGI